MANVLIVFATEYGQTAKIARRIANTLAEQGHRPTLFDADHPDERIDLDRFQVVVIGGPIHAGGYPRSVERFAREHRKELARIQSAFFSVGLAVASRTSDGRAQTLKVVDKFVARTGFRPGRVELIAGALPYTKYNFLIRFVMRRISAKEGGDTDTSRDYEYTDFTAVDRFARDLVQARDAATSSGPRRLHALPAQ
jgi:menaquinone-dependent protoporphyrinogen oxidase